MSTTAARRRPVLALLLAGALALLTVLAGAAPASAQTTVGAAAAPAARLADGLPPGVCSGVNPVLGVACQTVTGTPGLPSPGGAVGAVTGAVVGGVATAVGASALTALTQFVVDGAVWFLDQVGGALTATTAVSVTAAWFTARYQVMASIAAAIALLFLLLTGASTLLHRDPARLGRSVVMVAAAGLGTGAAVAVTGLLVAVSDQLCVAVTTGSGQDLRTALRGMGVALAATGVVTGNGAAPLFAVGLGAVVTALAAAVIWLELLLREVAIYAALLFFPIGLAGLAWAPSAAWARRLAELLAALIFAKFVIVAILTLAAAGLASGSQGFAGVLAGIALLVVSAFAPFLLLRLIGVAEVAAAAGVLEGARQRGTRPLISGGQMALYTVQRHGGATRVAAAGAAGPVGAGLLAARTGAGAAAHTGGIAVTKLRQSAPPAPPPDPPQQRRGA